MISAICAKNKIEVGITNDIDYAKTRPLFHLQTVKSYLKHSMVI
jgi:hypothetical protein